MLRGTRLDAFNIVPINFLYILFYNEVKLSTNVKIQNYIEILIYILYVLIAERWEGFEL